MKCLIIAAGQGSRLRSIAESKPLVPVLGVPLIERVIGSAANAGADDFYVVVGYEGDRVRSALETISRNLGVSITPVQNDEWRRSNGISVLKAKKFMTEPFLLTMSDHLYDPDIARRLSALELAEGEIVLAVDEDLQNPLVDMEDVTRVQALDGRIEKIGKGIEDYNAFDTGVFYCAPGLFSAIEKSSKDFNDDSLSGGVRVLAGEGRARVMPVGGAFWLDVDEPKSFDQAETILSNAPEIISGLKSRRSGKI